MRSSKLFVFKYIINHFEEKKKITKEERHAKIDPEYRHKDKCCKPGLSTLALYILDL